MKQELTAFIWPALVGVLAAALILDKWVLEPQETGNAPVNGGYRDAVALATPSVVNIYTAKLVDARTDARLNSPLQRRLFSNRGSRQRIERSLGSGVILSAAGHIVTNNHVIAGADAIQVLLADGRSASASVVGSDPETDLAILHIDLPELTPIALADAGDIAVGDVVAGDAAMAWRQQDALPVARLEGVLVRYRDVLATDRSVGSRADV